MSSNKIYGVDLEKNITPLMVRDALVRCFFEAHCLDAGLDQESEKSKLTEDYCRAIVTKAFFDVGGNFEEPNKATIIKVIANLKNFAEHFRDISIIDKHAAEIKQLLPKL